MSVLAEPQVFNQPNKLIEGWYWLLPSRKVKKGKAQAVNFMGRELVVYRGESGKVVAMDAYCPHMGAHLCDGKVEGDGIRCVFHDWKFSSEGKCDDIPCQKGVDFVPAIPTHPVEEKYGLIWLWTGKAPRHPVPYVPELKGLETDALLGNQFVKDCHPNVVMINAIDAQHFNTVHPMVKTLAGNLHLDPVQINENNIEFRNITPVPKESRIGRLLSRFYSGPLTYWMSYWNASTGSVTVGPDRLHFHIIFALRPTLDGKTQGQTILVTKKREGLLGKLWSWIILRATKVVGDYFAKGDTMIFRKIRFKLQAPIKADHAIIRFIQHAEKQKLSSWIKPDAHLNPSLMAAAAAAGVPAPGLLRLDMSSSSAEADPSSEARV